MVNITKIAEKYIAEHPSVKDCVKNKLINYSSLTRQIAKEENIDLKKNFDAILIACRRYAQKIKAEKVREKKIIEVIKQSKIEIKNKIIVVVVEKTIYFDHLIDLEKEIKKKAELFHVIQGTNAITIITADDFLPLIKKMFKQKIIETHTDLVEITLKSPKEIEETPGVLSYLYSLFGEHNINIMETMSCWTDTLFVVKEEDIGKVMEALRL